MKPIFILLAIGLSLLSCSGNASKATLPTETKQTHALEVLYFHGKQRCVTCNAIEKLTQEVVDSLANEEVVMKIIDLSKKENEAMADQYEVTWSSLILNANGKVENLTEMGFAYAKGKPEAFKAKLVEAINRLVQ